MHTQSEKFFKANVSLIDSKLDLSEGTGVIGIFAHGTSRTIYLEEGSDKKCITKYSMIFNNSTSGWERAEQESNNFLELAKDIKLLKNKSQAQKIIKISQTEISVFKKKMDEYSKLSLLTFDGEQDDDISAVMGAINKKWELHEQSCCTIL